MAFLLMKQATYGAYGPQTGAKKTKTQAISRYQNYKANDVGSKEVKVGPVDTIAKLAYLYDNESEAKRSLTEAKVNDKIKGLKNRLEVSRTLRKAGDGRR